MLLFALDNPSPLAAAIGHALGQAIAPHEDRRFEDGERKLRPLVDPRGEPAYVVASLHGDPDASPHDKLCRLLWFAATLRDHGAAGVTAVLPYLAYARKDRRTKPFDPLTLRYLAQAVEAMGVERVIVLEPHDVAAFENAFRCPTIALQGHRAFDAVADRWLAEGPVAVASPDPGGVKRALLWREHLAARAARPVGFAMVDKRRSAGVVSSERLVAGAVDGACVLLLDDLVATGDTMRRAAVALRDAGARAVVAVATHGLFVEPAVEVLADPVLDAVVVSDSVPTFRVPPASALARKLQGVSAAPLLADAIRACHAAWRR